MSGPVGNSKRLRTNVVVDDDEVKLPSSSSSSQSQSPMSASFDEAISLIFSFLTVREHLAWSSVSRRQMIISRWSRSTPRCCSSAAVSAHSAVRVFADVERMMKRFIHAIKLEISGWNFLQSGEILARMTSLRELSIDSLVPWTSFLGYAYTPWAHINTLTKLETVEVKGCLPPFSVFPRSLKHIILRLAYPPPRDCEDARGDLACVLDLTSLETLILPRHYFVKTKFLSELAIKLPRLTRLEFGEMDQEDDVANDDEISLPSSLTTVSFILDTEICGPFNPVNGVLDCLSHLPLLTRLKLKIIPSWSGFDDDELPNDEKSRLATQMKMLATSFKSLIHLSLEIPPSVYHLVMQQLVTTTVTTTASLCDSLRSFKLSMYGDNGRMGQII